MQIELNEVQIRNLLIFLNRAQITGQEADELVVLKMTLARALEAPLSAPIMEAIDDVDGKENGNASNTRRKAEQRA